MDAQKEQEWTEKLESEGYRTIYVVHDEAHKFYTDHTHDTDAMHILLEGDMIVTVDGETSMYKAGDRFETKPHQVHSARMGQYGCSYIVGENKK